MTNLSVNEDIEGNEEDKGDDAMSEEVEVDHVHLDIERVESQGSGDYFLILQETWKYKFLQVK